jgi:uncharacterized protein (TIGR00661 family)
LKGEGKLHVLVCPLNWGLGHATRCIPIINSLLSKGAKVTIAGSGGSLSLLRSEFPGLEFIEFHGFSPEYSRKGNMLLKMALLIPSFIWNILNEHSRLSRIIKQIRVDVVISDNRYGLWNKTIRSILITHQVFIRAPKRWKWLNGILLLVNRFLISRFDECWIPDFPGEKNLSGELSQLKPVSANYHFIGPLSRLNPSLHSPAIRDGILVVLSGPEPQRSILEEILTRQLEELDTEALIICGKTSPQPLTLRKGKLTIISYAGSDQMNDLLNKAALIICRSGYSTIMDLAAIGGKALFIPTPGQTEQEYLAGYYMMQGIAMRVNQHEINLKNDIPLAYAYPGFKPSSLNKALEHQIEMLLRS